MSTSTTTIRSFLTGEKWEKKPTKKINKGGWRVLGWRGLVDVSDWGLEGSMNTLHSRSFLDILDVAVVGICK